VSEQALPAALSIPSPPSREVGGWGRVPFSRNFMKPTPRRKWYSTPSPNLSPYIFLGLDPSPPPLAISSFFEGLHTIFDANIPSDQNPRISSDSEPHPGVFYADNFVSLESNNKHKRHEQNLIRNLIRFSQQNPLKLEFPVRIPNERFYGL